MVPSVISHFKISKPAKIDEKFIDFMGEVYSVGTQEQWKQKVLFIP
jgi:hypothetical protein